MISAVPHPPATPSTPQPWHRGPRAGSGSTLGTRWPILQKSRQALGRARTGAQGSCLLGQPQASLRRWCLPGRGQ